MNMREQIAGLAARLVAEGLDDYQAAKEKAGRQLGLRSNAPLPTTMEIDQALMVHLRLFFGAKQELAVHHLRRAAMRFMGDCERFSPALYGPVLTGTAVQTSAIRIEFPRDPDESKDIELFFLNAGWKYRISGRSGEIRAGKPTRITYEMEYLGNRILVSLAGRRGQYAHRDWVGRANSVELGSLFAPESPG
jgi:hypothetical protein